MRSRNQLPQNPMITSLLVLVAVLIVESLLVGLTRPLVLSQPPAVRWLITLALLAASVVAVQRTRWLRPTPRPNWLTFGGVTLLVLYSVQALGDRVRELPQALGLPLALVLAALVAFLLWRVGPRLGSGRAWLAGLGGVAAFFTLYV